mmetsp:Transcript_15319/g.46279  ORF Transcript_15319/g.46279 Transcript_15319/m.46279 type:complete len:475 (-) Transcript_15319:963-2387(-)|eukprot:CAMPEP_0206136442 /NCGR_PEP_ID=MMETSP1473-20131121/1679_1 /ASSEMBLY_ACC=CAM_ASM_001109 /TAXON_ID=1461547 /ORGANISM="Stichococcus sp, Strain RCC1054" /LENGTH=474 /DNA_ID=CAMNT_0053528983 /DNA_START=1432 /DNA_END=2856 /DNA_ORIENTATION=-
MLGGAANGIAPVPAAKKIALFCDGTWCGEATGTHTNMKFLAECTAGATLRSGVPHTRSGDDVSVCYFDGVGLSGDFWEYLTNAAIATDLADRCTEVYRTIVDQFEKGSEVWLFGFSRGAFTVRSVAGMINNWGIIDASKVKEGHGDVVSSKVLGHLCDTVYSQYRSRDPAYAPNGTFAKRFIEAYGHDLIGRPPVRFMGLIETVGALGVPRVDSGVGLRYEFYDQMVSTSVENVFQALATHDRMGPFEPCFVRRNDKSVATKRGKSMHLRTEEAWFPGAHYDVGRQRFVFPRATGSTPERTLHWLNDSFNLMGINVRPTEKYSNLVLEWLMLKMTEVDSEILPEANLVETYAGPASASAHWLSPAAWLPPQSVWFPLCPELSIDAYDVLATTVPQVLNPFKGLVLQDRRVPLYSDAEFIGKAIDFADVFKSQTYVIDNLMNVRLFADAGEVPQPRVRRSFDISRPGWLKGGKKA